jgi:exodeoxyribonuclease V
MTTLAPPAFVAQNPQQAAAIELLLDFATGAHGARVMTLEGYAGTGKTTLVGELVRRLAQLISLAVSAPTHKAVGVLRSKIGDVPGIDYGSVHSFLGLRMRERDDGTHECRPEGVPTLGDYHLVVVDECSMIGRELFARILSPAYDTRILFVGDPAQLPPVNDQQHSPTFTAVRHKAVLTEVVRQAAENPVIRISMRIREAIEASARITNGDLRQICPDAPSDALFATGGAITAYNWALHDIRDGRDTRILAWRNETVRRYNRDLHAAMYGEATPFAIGEAVVMNDGHDARADAGGDPLKAPKVPLFNSEELTVVAIEPGEHPRHPGLAAWRLILARADGARAVLWIANDENDRQRQITTRFATATRLKAELVLQRDRDKDDERRYLIAQAWALRNDLADARHVYAMTVHKAQGSTFDTAIVDLADLERNRSAEFNQLLYVATTRPRHHLAFVAP